MNVPCRHNIGGKCELQPDAPLVPAMCMTVCPEYDGPSRGLGDTVHKFIQVTTLGMIRPCGGCKGRQAALNKAFPRAEGH